MFRPAVEVVSQAWRVVSLPRVIPVAGETVRLIVDSNSTRFARLCQCTLVTSLCETLQLFKPFDVNVLVCSCVLI